MLQGFAGYKLGRSEVHNKRALGPWVAHLKMTVNKGTGKHSSFQSPAMNFDRSAVSLSLYMKKFPLVILTQLKGCRTSAFLYISLRKTYEIRGEAIFWPTGA